MALQIFLSSSLRKYVPDYDPSKGIELAIPRGTSVSEVCRELAIPTEPIKIIMVDGIGKSLDHILEGNERVGLFPPVGGG